MAMGIGQFDNPSVMKHDFSQVPHVEIPRSSFRRSHGLKTAFNSGYLVPIYVDEALPGDTLSLKLSSVARMPTLLYPLMDNLYLDFFFFAVPNRLVWDNFQKFMGEQKNPGDSIDYLVPQMDMDGVSVALGSLGDYFGLPTAVAGLEFNSLHFRAYNLIYNEWFRDQNLQDSVVVDTDDGPDDPADYVLLRRCKRHDYFTSCLPWPQKGVAVELPLGTLAPVVGTTKGITLYDGTNESNFFNYSANWNLALSTTANKNVGAADATRRTSGGDLTIGLTTDPAKSGMVADLSTATAATINELREAFQLQRMMERDARGGTRYTEIVRSHFRVDSPDARLQRPEYLGGGTKRMVIDPVPVTADVGGSFSGKLRAAGYMNVSGIGFTKSFVEHCLIIGLVNVRADLTYQCGVNRMWSRQTKYDYYWPALAHLGEQAVLNKEIYAQGSASDDNVFGYQERWSEYRYKPSMITGVMRSTAASSLDAWHLSQEFGSLPVLNETFIVEDPPIDRVIAVPSQPQIIFDGYFDIICTRPMPTYSVPGLIDHF